MDWKACREINKHSYDADCCALPKESFCADGFTHKLGKVCYGQDASYGARYTTVCKKKDKKKKDKCKKCEEKKKPKKPKKPKKEEDDDEEDGASSGGSLVSTKTGKEKKETKKDKHKILEVDRLLMVLFEE